jgi:DNA-binding XRE family transcriptional regulator
MESTAITSRLRERRLECGFTQAELAARAGVSRQLVAAVETGHNMPAVDAGLALARALATTVEDLFSHPAATPFTPALGGRLADGTPLRAGKIGDHLVVAELADHGTAGAGWAKPDGILTDGRLNLFPGAEPAGIVLAGCDPAIGVAEAMLQGLGPRSMLAISTASGTALQALKRARIHAAVVHGPAGELPAPPVPVLRLHLARWQVGLAIPQTSRRPSLEALLQGKKPIAQRDPAAASQQALARADARFGISSQHPGPRAAGHIDAARIATTLRCAAVTTEPASRAFDLRFLPLEEHTVEIWLAEQWDEALAALGNTLVSAAFTQRVAQFGGYDLTECGTVIHHAHA